MIEQPHGHASSRHPQHLLERLPLLPDKAQGSYADDHVEAAIAEWQPTSIGSDETDVTRGMRNGKPERVAIEIGTDYCADRAARSKAPGEIPGTAAYIQQCFSALRIKQRFKEAVLLFADPRTAARCIPSVVLLRSHRRVS